MGYVYLQNSNLALQQVSNIDIRTLDTGRYYVTNSSNLPTGWIAAYLDVERIDNRWCRITAWPPYKGPDVPQMTKQCDSEWLGWECLITGDNLAYVGGAVKIEAGYDNTAYKDYISLFYNNGNRTVISFDNTGIQCDVMEGTQWRTKWRK